jgi:AcrR family transcriptional regulator
MARKKGTDSRAALVRAAWELLVEQGLPGMSVDAVVTRARLSKGTFFHFFPTKAALLDALCVEIADQAWQRAAAALERRDLDPVARLDLLLGGLRSWRTERPRAIGGLWWELARPHNAALMSKVRTLGTQRLAPAVAGLLAEAVAHGSIAVDDVEVVARLVVDWMYATVEGSMRLLAERRDRDAADLVLRRANATLAALERILGAAPGSLRRVDRQVVEQLAAALPAGESTDDQRGGAP